MKEIEHRTEGQIRLEPGNLYRYIRRLEKLGMVSPAGHRREENDTSERRRYYQVTSRGRAVLRADASRMRLLAAAAEAKLALHGEDL